MDKKRLFILLALIAAVAAFFIFDLKQYVSLEFFQQQRARIDAYYAENVGRRSRCSCCLRRDDLAVHSRCRVLTLIAGAVFGWLVGTVLTSFASAIGGTLAFLSSRWLLRDWVQQRFGDRMAAVDAGMVKDGAFYLFALRLVPLFPFFLVNLLMGLTKIRTWTFYWVSQLGMLAGTATYVYAGSELGKFRISPSLLIVFTLIGVFPLIAKKVLDAIRARKVYARWKKGKPRSYDYNLVVIGAGSAGLVSAYIGAATKQRSRWWKSTRWAVTA